MAKLTKEALFKLIKQNDIEQMRNQLEKGLDANTVKNKRIDHTNLLDTAFEDGSLEMAQLLINFGAKTLYGRIVYWAANKGNYEMLELAISHYKTNLIRYLTDYGMSKELEKKYISFITTPEIFTPNEIKDFAVNVKFNYPNRLIAEYHTFLDMALEWAASDTNMTKLLLENGAKFNYLGVSNPMCVATAAGNMETVELFFNLGVSVNDPILMSNFPKYPILGAINAKKSDITKFLLEKGAKLDLETGNRNPPVLSYALNKIRETKDEVERKELFAIVGLLLQYKCPVEDERKSFLNDIHDIEVIDLFEPYANHLPEKSLEVLYEKRLKLLFL